MIDIFVLPSKSPEPFATNVIEAAMTKLAIVATNIGGTPEFIKHNKNGLLVKPNDSSSLRGALIRLIRDKKLAKKLANQAFSDSQKFSEENLARRLETIYQNLISS